jgi:hypothetical protein
VTKSLIFDWGESGQKREENKKTKKTKEYQYQYQNHNKKQNKKSILTPSFGFLWLISLANFSTLKKTHTARFLDKNPDDNCLYLCLN